MSSETPPDLSRTHAAVRRSRWPGWIWAIPIAAILLVGWWLVRTFLTGGEDITIAFDDVHGLKQSNSNVVYRGMDVGKVLGMELTKDGKAVEVRVKIQGGATAFLKSGTKFWLRGAEPNLSDPSSLSAVISGPTIIMEPGSGQKTTHFVGLAHKPVVADAERPHQIFRILLNGAVGELKPGGPVKLRGFTVGEVTDIGFRYDPKRGEIRTPVMLALYPSLFHLEASEGLDAKGALFAAIERLIEKGLRARLERNPPLVGTPGVELDIVPDEGSPTDALVDEFVDGMPQIPAAPADGLNSIVNRINKVPIDEITKNVLAITHRAEAIVSSRKLTDSIGQLDATLQQVHQTTESAGPQIRDVVSRMRKTAAQLADAVKAIETTAKTAQETAKSANKMLGGEPSQNGMPTTMREVTEAARSVRDLANFLDRHPEALVQGRSEQ